MNDMMIAALQKQRSGKVDAPPPQSQGPEKPQGIEERLEALEAQYQELCDFVGMNKEKEAPKAVSRGY